MIGRWLLAAATAFLVGSLPWGLWIGRFARGVDVRRHGSGNLGATNVYRVLGPGWGITVLLLDAAKGVAAVFLARALAASPHAPALTPPALATSAQVLATSAQALATSAHALANPVLAHGAESWGAALGLIASILGHTFSPLARFRGGKGVATAAGAWGAIAPLPLACALAAWTVIFACTRIVSAGSIVAALALPVAVAALPSHRPAAARDPVFWLACLTACLLVLRHRSNLRRLLRGEEKPLSLRGRTAAPAGGAR